MKELIMFRHCYKNPRVRFHLQDSNMAVAASVEEPVVAAFPGTRKHVIIKRLIRYKFHSRACVIHITRFPFAFVFIFFSLLSSTPTTSE